MTDHEDTRDVEQRRLDLIAADRPLYEYICHVVATKTLDSAGDTASGFDHRVANVLWRRAGEHRRAAESARDD